MIAKANYPGLVSRNVLRRLGTQLISWGLTFAVLLYLQRYVGDTGLSNPAFADSFVLIFGVFVLLVTSTVPVREIARDHRITGGLLVAASLAFCLALSTLMLYGVEKPVVRLRKRLSHTSPTPNDVVRLDDAVANRLAASDAEWVSEGPRV